MLALLEQLVTYESLDECSMDLVQVNNAVFKKDFSHWNRGQKIPLLAINDEEGVVSLISFDENDEEVARVKVELGVSP